MSYENSFSDFKCINFAGYTQQSPMLPEDGILTAEEHCEEPTHPFSEGRKTEHSWYVDGRLLWKNVTC